jgi:hypothetical protein
LGTLVELSQPGQPAVSGTGVALAAVASLLLPPSLQRADTSPGCAPLDAIIACKPFVFFEIPESDHARKSRGIPVPNMSFKVVRNGELTTVGSDDIFKPSHCGVCIAGGLHAHLPDRACTALRGARPRAAQAWRSMGAVGVDRPTREGLQPAIGTGRRWSCRSIGRGPPTTGSRVATVRDLALAFRFP